MQEKPAHHRFAFVFVCPPEGGLGSSWLKHALKERSPNTLVGVVYYLLLFFFDFDWAVG
jgi:hypothetical protein